ncbi:hypothetical protein [Xanthocytophaga flava]|uniref:hypothetical protein n=1 Tax=Xanthocytophaga flava TaxID=3048013 RepID=UPI0028D46977|nr:hypothetical protein [Xanthocytophaga flavus]MDJ1472851.1 hypothetical protein [Xanthocytophaga flavus]
MVKVLIDTVGDVSYYIASKCEFTHIEGNIEFITYKLVQTPGKPEVWVKSPLELPRMLVDNGTKIPVVDSNYQPKMITVQVPTDEYVMIPVPGTDPIGTNENGNPVYDMVPDYGQPILQDVQIQKTIGEYDMILALFLYQIPPVSIATMIETGIKRRLNMIDPETYVFVEP